MFQALVTDYMDQFLLVKTTEKLSWIVNNLVLRTNINDYIIGSFLSREDTKKINIHFFWRSCSDHSQERPKGYLFNSYYTEV